MSKESSNTPRIQNVGDLGDTVYLLPFSFRVILAVREVKWLLGVPVPTIIVVALGGMQKIVYARLHHYSR